MSRWARSILVVALVPVLLAIAAPVANADISSLYLIRANNSVLTSEFALSSFSFNQSVESGVHGYGSPTDKYLVASSANLTKRQGKDSPELLSAVVKGTHFNELRFQFNKGSTPYIRYCFQDVLLTSQHSGSGGDPLIESIGFNFAKMSTLNNPATDNLADGCSGGSKSESPKSPGVDAWALKLKVSQAKANLGVACLSKTCAGTIKMLSQGGACPAAKGCKPLGLAKFKLAGGDAKTLRMKLTKSGVAKLKLKPNLAVSLFGRLKGHKQQLIRRNALALPAVQKTLVDRSQLSKRRHDRHAADVHRWREEDWGGRCRRARADHALRAGRKIGERLSHQRRPWKLLGRVHSGCHRRLGCERQLAGQRQGQAFAVPALRDRRVAHTLFSDPVLPGRRDSHGCRNSLHRHAGTAPAWPNRADRLHEPEHISRRHTSCDARRCRQLLGPADAGAAGRRLDGGGPLPWRRQRRPRRLDQLQLHHRLSVRASGSCASPHCPDMFD